MNPSYSEAVGVRLRAIRKQRGLSLQDVQKRSEGEFKAAVLGAYERGERSLSLPRLQRLASFFQVPITQMLPQEDQPEAPIVSLPMPLWWARRSAIEAWRSCGLSVDASSAQTSAGVVFQVITPSSTNLPASVAVMALVREPICHASESVTRVVLVAISITSTPGAAHHGPDS